MHPQRSRGAVFPVLPRAGLTVGRLQSGIGSGSLGSSTRPTLGVDEEGAEQCSSTTYLVAGSLGYNYVIRQPLSLPLSPRSARARLRSQETPLPLTQESCFSLYRDGRPGGQTHRTPRAARSGVPPVGVACVPRVRPARNLAEPAGSPVSHDLAPRSPRPTPRARKFKLDQD
eukprot:scaffold62214_cov71-Phaeocystis_antarctica.AAC.6